MKKAVPLTPAEERRLVAAYLNTELSVYDLARRFHINDIRVSECLERHNVPRRATNRKRVA